MPLTRSDILPGGVQDKNAGNSGDLVKHTTYLALLETLRHRVPWRDRLGIVEAHSGKGLYLSTSPHWRTFRERGAGPLLAAQSALVGPAPTGLGPIPDLEPNEYPYAGSALLHLAALSAAPPAASSLTGYDRFAPARHTLARLLEEPCFADAKSRTSVALASPAGDRSEPGLLAALRRGNFDRTDILHFDPFAFVMAADDQSHRDVYRELLTECDARVGAGLLGAASVFITWGSNGRAALDDLEGPGFDSGLRGGYQDLLTRIAPHRRIVVTWCWEFYFSLLFVVPEDLRDELIDRFEADLAPLRPFCKDAASLTVR